MKVISVLLTAVALATPAAAEPAALGAWGVDLSGMDRSVAPGDDFFAYASGVWEKTAEIPPDRSGTGSFLDLRIMSEQRMLDLAAELNARPRAQLNAEETKLRDFYESYTDQAAIEARGLAAAKPDLDAIAALKTHEDVARLMGTRRLRFSGPFGVGIGMDDKNPDRYAITLNHAGLGLANRDYYLRDDLNFPATRDAYRKYIATMLTLAGRATTDADTRAQAIYDLEHKIADAHWPNADRRDADKTYNPMTFAELTAFTAPFPWAAYFAAAGLPAAPDRQIIVAEKSAMPALAKIFAATPVAVWRDYLTVHYLHGYAAVLPKAIDDADFAFYGKVIQGNAQPLPRERRAVLAIDGAMGEAFGKLYVAKYFPAAAQAKAKALVDNILKVYDTDIRVLEWMNDEMRARALEKLHQFTPHIGAPETWRDYAALKIERGDLLGNVQRSGFFEWQRHLARLDQPVDRNEWSMTPPTVNAYYSQGLNAIFFPAAILQAPFFDANADDAVNYGAIGAVIAHEISHGFDDQGSKYDGRGALNNWWSEDARKAFEQRTKVLGAQYYGFEGLPGIHVNGAFTMGENIADLSGVTVALKAYHLSLGGKPAPVLDGFTGDQRFFLSYAQIWREKTREGALRQRLLSDAHSPPKFRLIGVTRNVDEWYTAFGVKPGQARYLPPADRVRLW